MGDEQGTEMQMAAPESAGKTGRYDVFTKKDIPASKEAGYRFPNKKIRAAENHRPAPERRGNTQGDKNKSRRPRKRECVSAHGDVFAAIIVVRPQKLEGACIDFSKVHAISMTHVIPA
ncbi:hypothetical protein [Rhizobium hidalgonense]|uniref:hypothetical protein n=1 Tax=Rhizobium hidalgonense TaxID=1538159 RepID=UPI002870C09E|nr:hypothetical protein [Rhizobium hidalgonense]MDR9808181.1 hypothetical protein [Rhizobium hidalgonense]